MAKEQNAQNQKTVPNPDLRALDKLVGTWEVSGGAEGKIKFEWMEGGFFLVQHIELLHDGQLIKAIEYIGHEQKFGEPSSKEIKTRVFSFLDGMTLDYIYEMDGNNLTIWYGEKGSPSFMKGRLSEDGSTMTVEWTYPGGGYKATGKRIN
jgi:hypothetical protein